MIEKRPAEGLGRTSFGGVQALHHFCFGPYQSSERLHWGRLRMLNRLRLEPKGLREPNWLGQMEVLLIVETGEIIVECGETRLVVGERGIAHLILRAGCDYGFHNGSGQTAEVIELWFTTDCWKGQPTAAAGRLIDWRGIAVSHRPNERAASSLRSAGRAVLLDSGFAKPDRYALRGAGHAYFCVLDGEWLLGDQTCRRDDSVAIEAEEGISVQMVSAGRCLVIECPAG